MSETGRDQARLLIIDDDPEIRNVLHEFLSRSYQCVAVNCAEDALMRLATDTFELIISDLTMERMNGLEMVPLIHKVAPRAVIVMISGLQTIDYAIEAMSAGAFDYVTKPFDLREVDAAVSRALDHHKLLAARQRYPSSLEELVKHRSAEVDHPEYYDTVTDLPNRLLFERRVRESLVLAKDAQQMRGIFFLAVDGFKEINEKLGHSAGDSLLKDLAGRLKQCVNESDTVARFDEDEFALLLTRVTATQDLADVSRSINEVLEPSFVLEGQEICLSASLGISLFPCDGEDPGTLLQNAWTALYRARTHRLLISRLSETTAHN